MRAIGLNQVNPTSHDRDRKPEIAPERPPSALLTSDSRTVIVVEPQHDGRLRGSYTNWAEPQVIERDEVLELRWVGGPPSRHRASLPAAPLGLSDLFPARPLHLGARDTVRLGLL
jgi:hypothetical protein